MGFHQMPSSNLLPLWGSYEGLDVAAEAFYAVLNKSAEITR